MHAFDIRAYQPLVGVPVEIQTNWKTYFATLQRSVFGGFEFEVIGQSHTVQLTTVIDWNFVS